MQHQTKEFLGNILKVLPQIHFRVIEVRVCVFLTAVMSRFCGLASTTQSRLHEHEKLICGGRRLTEMDALELATYCLSDNPLEASVGLASLNSLIGIDERLCTEANAFDLIVEKGRGKTVAVVGHFPFVGKLKQEAQELWVLEQHPREDDLPKEMAGEVLPCSEVVAITSATLINHTLGDILSLCPPRSFKMLLGPSTPMTPVAFDYGIDAVAGVKVVDPQAVVRTISQGAHFRAVEGVKRLTMIKK